MKKLLFILLTLGTCVACGNNPVTPDPDPEDTTKVPVDTTTPTPPDTTKQGLWIVSSLTKVQPMTGLVLWPAQARSKNDTYNHSISMEFSYCLPCKVVTGKQDGQIQYDWTWFENLLNDIVWAYQTGGRSLRHFSRKHDNILFYRKTERYDFNIEAVMAPRQAPRTSHMRRHMDPDGRVYRSIRSNGRVYTYYDDDPVAPSDVWQDLNHLQQKDPERTGYDTQKPLALLTRIILSSTNKNGWILDPFAGSSTTGIAANLIGRRYLGIEQDTSFAEMGKKRRMEIENLQNFTEYRNKIKDIAIADFYNIDTTDCVSENDEIYGLPF